MSAGLSKRGLQNPKLWVRSRNASHSLLCLPARRGPPERHAVAPWCAMATVGTALEERLLYNEPGQVLRFTWYAVMLLSR